MQENKLLYPDTNEGNIALYRELSRIESSTENMAKQADQRTPLLILLSKRGLSVEPVMKPFAGYKDFNECVSRNRDKDDPKAYCAEIMRRVEGNK